MAPGVFQIFIGLVESFFRLHGILGGNAALRNGFLQLFFQSTNPGLHLGLGGVGRFHLGVQLFTLGGQGFDLLFFGQNAQQFIGAAADHYPLVRQQIAAAGHYGLHPSVLIEQLTGRIKGVGDHHVTEQGRGHGFVAVPDRDMVEQTPIGQRPFVRTIVHRPVPPPMGMNPQRPSWLC